MPRNASGAYTLPTAAGNPVVTGTAIRSSWANLTLADIVNALTDSLSRSGNGAMTAQFKAISGSNAEPGVGFSAKTNSGLVLDADGQSVGVTINSSRVATVKSAGIELESAATADKHAVRFGEAKGVITPSAVVLTWSGSSSQAPDEVSKPGNPTGGYVVSGSGTVTVLKNTNSRWAAGGTFTADRAGLYLAVSSASVLPGDLTPKRISAFPYINGAHQDAFRRVATDYGQVQHSMIVPLAVNDTFQMRLWNASGGGVTIASGSLAIVYLGAA